ncbi:MAG: CBS domain-containing protein [Azonexus sp.]|jgi:CBS domain-containing protein|nr:CBS domain-containing protein [Azonexus sp.]
MQVREILRVKGSALFTVSSSQTLSFAIDSMADLDVGSLVVMDDGKMVGMLTFREILLALRAHAKGPDDLTVGDVMVKNPVTAFPDMEVNQLRGLMIEKHSRYLPVLDGDVLMGVISFLDVAKAVLEEQSFENKMLKSYIKNWPSETPVA